MKSEAWTFSGQWPPEPPKTLSEQLGKRIYRHGTIILQEGRPGDKVCFLIKGRCMIYTTGQSGQVLIQNVVSAPEVFGMIEQFRGLNNVCSVEAFGEAHTLEVSREGYLAWLASDHAFALEMLRRVAEIAYHQIEYQSANILSPLRQRFIGYLIAHHEGEEKIVLDKQVLAGRLASTVRHLNRTIQACVADGVIEYQEGRLRVLDWQKLH